MLQQKNLFTKLCLSGLFLLLFSFNSFAFELNDYELYYDGQVKQDDYGYKYQLSDKTLLKDGIYRILVDEERGQTLFLSFDENGYISDPGDWIIDDNGMYFLLHDNNRFKNISIGFDLKSNSVYNYFYFGEDGYVLCNQKFVGGCYSDDSGLIHESDGSLREVRLDNDIF